MQAEIASYDLAGFFEVLRDFVVDDCQAKWACAFFRGGGFPGRKCFGFSEPGRDPHVKAGQSKTREELSSCVRHALCFSRL